MIKKYFFFVALTATYQVFSKLFYRNLENNLNPDKTQDSSELPNVNLSNFFINFYNYR